LCCKVVLRTMKFTASATIAAANTIDLGPYLDSGDLTARLSVHITVSRGKVMEYTLGVEADCKTAPEVGNACGSTS